MYTRRRSKDSRVLSLTRRPPSGSAPDESFAPSTHGRAAPRRRRRTTKEGQDNLGASAPAAMRAVLLLAAAAGYEVYEDGYANEKLPGSDGGWPNLPYSVDANRYSDGASSVSPLTDTAPAFPLHHGEISDAPAGRRRLAEAKLASEQERHQTLLDKEKHQGKCGPFIRSPLCAATMCCSSDLAYQLPQTWPLLGSATACRQE